MNSLRARYLHGMQRPAKTFWPIGYVVLQKALDLLCVTSCAIACVLLRPLS